MREHVREFVSQFAETFCPQGPVYEFGSYLVDGQSDLADLRPLFPGQRYVGCDMRRGPGVDRLEDVTRLSLTDESVSTVLCLDTLEHVFDVPRAAGEMIRVLRPGGMIVVSAPMDFRIHAYPDDYWRLTPSCLERLLSPLGATVVGSQGPESHPHTVLAIGCKSPVPDDFVQQAMHLVHAHDAWCRAQEQQTPWTKRTKRLLRAPLRSRGEHRREREYYASRFLVHVHGDTASGGSAPGHPHATTSRSAETRRNVT